MSRVPTKLSFIITNLLFISSTLVTCSLPSTNDIIDLSYFGNTLFVETNAGKGEKLKTWNASSGLNPEELGEYAEGDMVLPRRQVRTGLAAISTYWPGGVVPYQFAHNHSKNALEMIARAMEVYRKYTCVNFRPRTPSDKDYVVIKNIDGGGCWSHVGRIRNEQEMNLEENCTTRLGTILHEFMHTLGFLHEHSRIERDDYIKIDWDNIDKDQLLNFRKSQSGYSNSGGVPYNYCSVMHYSPFAFSMNGYPTIYTTNSSAIKKIGQRDGFSKGDIAKINERYNCPQKTLALFNETLTDIDAFSC